jgi:hypothetical protein
MPSWLRARNSSHATEPLVGAGAVATTSATTEEPSGIFQVGPAKCVPICKPCLSNRFASGALKTHAKPWSFASQA